MRVTATSYYNSIYGDNNKLNRQLFDVSKQISSGQKIEYVHEAPGTFIDTLRLDSEVTTLEQTKSSAQNAYKFSTQTDTAIGEIVKTIESMKVKMINAANDANSDTSMLSIAKELRGLQNHLFTLANSSVGGQYLFSGSATSQKPVDSNGNYLGNNQNISAFLGSGIKQKYNISGSQLFLGNETNVTRSITTNIGQLSLTDLYPDIMQSSTLTRTDAKETYITSSSTIRDLMGDTDTDRTNDIARQAYYYVQGTRSDGTAFKTKIQMNMTDKVDDLLHQIALLYDPNQLNPLTDKVDVTLNAHGQIEITDKQYGSSKLDFHMVGAVDFDSTGIDAANVTNLDSLQSGTTDFSSAISGSGSLYIKEFMKSGNNYVNGTAPVTAAVFPVGSFIINGTDIGAVSTIVNDTDNALLNAINAKTMTTGVVATHTSMGGISLHTNNNQNIVISGLDNGAASGLSNGTYNFGALEYDKIYFHTNGAKLTSNVSQVITGENTLAIDKTQFGSVASGTIHDLINDRYSGLDGKVLKMSGTDINGKAYDLQINLLDAGSTVTVNSAQGVVPPLTFNLENSIGSATDAGKLTYRQIMDVLNMAVTNSLPLPLAPAPLNTYNGALNNASTSGAVTLDYAGRLTFEDKLNPITKATISLYDQNSGDFSSSPSIATFSANNTLTVRDPKKDLFSDIEQMIKSVEEYKKRSDGNSKDPRNIGIQNSIKMIDDLNDHITRMQTEAGAYSQVLQSTSDRTDMLIVSTKTLRSEVIDTDVAEATLRVQQLSLNYQALLSNISKVSKLSLVNYL